MLPRTLGLWAATLIGFSNLAVALAADLTTPPCLVAVPTAKDTVQLNWTPVAGALKYRLVRLYLEDTVEWMPTNPSFEDKGLTKGKNYTYTVFAIDKDNKSSPASASVTVKLPNALFYYDGFNTGLLDSSRWKQISGNWFVDPKPLDTVLQQLTPVDKAINKILFVGGLATETASMTQVMAKVRIDAWPTAAGAASSPVKPVAAPATGSTSITLPSGEVITVTPAPAPADPAKPAAAPPFASHVGVSLGCDKDSGAGYSFVFLDGDKVGFINDSPGNEKLGTSFHYPWKVGSGYWMKFGRQGNLLLGKVWGDCDPEPSDWLFTQLIAALDSPIKPVAPATTPISTTHASGFAGLDAGNSKDVKSSFDDFSVQSLSTQFPDNASLETSDLAKMVADCFKSHGHDTTHSMEMYHSNGPDDEILGDDSFHNLPTVESVDPRDPLNDLDGPPSSYRGQDYVASYAFPGAAKFDRREFGPGGELYLTDGVIIYEGMRILVKQDGHFAVSLNTHSPAVLVTLKLQLTFSDHHGRPFAHATVPPITLDPDLGTNSQSSSDSPETFEPNTWKVGYEGYSRELAVYMKAQSHGAAHAHGHWDPLDPPFCVTRRGTARFGDSRPQRIHSF